MGIFLNSTAPFEAYKITALDKYFVDKTMLIEELIPSIGRTSWISPIGPQNQVTTQYRKHSVSSDS